MSMFPFVHFDSIELDAANALLEQWQHQMGPIHRPNNDTVAHALYHEGRPVAITTTSGLIREWAGGGLTHLTRATTCDLSRLCAERRDLNRVVLRLWREFVFPSLHFGAAISYQDADIHTGDIYRFDGWVRAAYSPSGGIDKRRGSKGRNKWIWCWPPRAATDSFAFMDDAA